ncbi:MAG TPA: DinB family protein [Longimicrobium sp.]|nr:DinB family protein [Longimicrobium sp.]
MTTTAISIFERPAQDEHAEYYGRYIKLVPDGDLLEFLDRQTGETDALLRGIPANLHDHRYAEGKWSIKEMIGHVADAERIFAYRALRFSRGDATPLASFDENAYVANARFAEQDFGALVDEWLAVRRATLALLRGMNADEAARRGIASESQVSVRALAWIIAGHVIHHTSILRERYLGAS